MPLFHEIDLETAGGGRITAVEPDSVASEIGLRPGDELLAVDAHPVEDVIDVQYYTADEAFELLVRRDGDYLLFEAERPYNRPLGLEFAHPTFDTDIRRCNNLCEFCFVLQMAPRFRRTLYIKDDDYRYSFLFGHYVTLTNLSEHDWWRIETMRLSPLYVSVHATDLALRRRFLRNENAPDIMPQLRRLAAAGIEVHTQIVVVPGFNDGTALEESLVELAALWPAVRSVTVVPVGLTKQHKYGMRPHTAVEAAAMLDRVDGWQRMYQKSFGVRFVYATDEWYLVAQRPLPPAAAYDGQALEENGLGMVRRFLDEWQAVQKEIGAWLAANPSPGAFPGATLVTGTLFAPVLSKAAAELKALVGAPLTVKPIVNERLGDTITAAGLLMGADILAQMDETPDDLLVLPRVAFDHPDRITLDDVTPGAIATRLGRPVFLADTMGDVWDALIGQSATRYDPRPA